MDKNEEAAAAALLSEVQAVKAWIEVEKARIRGADKDFAAIQETVTIDETAEAAQPCSVEAPAGLAEGDASA